MESAVAERAVRHGVPRFISIREAYEELSLSRTAFYALIANGRITAYRLGPKNRGLRIARADLDAFVESCRTNPAEALPVKSPPPRRRLRELKPRRRGEKR